MPDVMEERVRSIQLGAGLAFALGALGATTPAGELARLGRESGRHGRTASRSGIPG